MPDNDRGAIPSDDVTAALAPQRPAWPTDPASLDFTTTAELAPIDGTVAQQPAADAIRPGSGIPMRGLSVFAIAASGARIRRAVTAVLAEATSARRMCSTAENPSAVQIASCRCSWPGARPYCRGEPSGNQICPGDEPSKSLM